MRVLYVAMTRAKEKLILTGGIKNMDKMLTKWGSICRQEGKQQLYYQLSNAANYLDWVIPALMRHRGFEEILKPLGIRQDINNPLYGARTEITIKQYSYEEAAQYEYAEQIYNRVNQKDLGYWDTGVVYNESIRKEIRSRMDYQYPYQAETNIHTKLTVSELKKLGQLEAEDFGVPIKGIERRSREFPVPEFIRESDTVAGSDLGTLYHGVLKSINLTLVKTKGDLEAFLEGLLHKGKISSRDRLALDIEKLFQFTASPIAERMRKAMEAGRLYRERQFVMGMKAGEINSSLRSEELVLIQGIIDVYFEEDNEWVLLDYKTDTVDEPDGEEILVRRYGVQLDYYQKALEQLTGKRVKERIIYSFGLNKEIKAAN